ncbi:hypothetical protein HK096_010815 [Nowakowskiella sp. JEL0078]|nr:hypothetical protein HK096_010815 [Nowakowskiella sp. JEL0078]
MVGCDSCKLDSSHRDDPADFESDVCTSNLNAPLPTHDPLSVKDHDVSIIAGVSNHTRTLFAHRSFLIKIPYYAGLFNFDDTYNPIVSRNNSLITSNLDFDPNLVWCALIFCYTGKLMLENVFVTQDQEKTDNSQGNLEITNPVIETNTEHDNPLNQTRLSSPTTISTRSKLSIASTATNSDKLNLKSVTTIKSQGKSPSPLIPAKISSATVLTKNSSPSSNSSSQFKSNTSHNPSTSLRKPPSSPRLSSPKSIPKLDITTPRLTHRIPNTTRTKPPLFTMKAVTHLEFSVRADRVAYYLGMSDFSSSLTTMIRDLLHGAHCSCTSCGFLCSIFLRATDDLSSDMMGILQNDVDECVTSQLMVFLLASLESDGGILDLDRLALLEFARRYCLNIGIDVAGRVMLWCMVVRETIVDRFSSGVVRKAGFFVEERQKMTENKSEKDFKPIPRNVRRVANALEILSLIEQHIFRLVQKSPVEFLERYLIFWGSFRSNSKDRSFLLRDAGVTEDRLNDQWKLQSVRFNDRDLWRLMDKIVQLMLETLIESNSVKLLTAFETLSEAFSQKGDSDFNDIHIKISDSKRVCLEFIGKRWLGLQVSGVLDKLNPSLLAEVSEVAGIALSEFSKKPQSKMILGPETRTKLRPRILNPNK